MELGANLILYPKSTLLKIMKRYDPIQRFDQGGYTLGEMKQRDDGDWVAFEDAEKLRDALEQIARIYENPEPPTMYELSGRAYDMRCIARNVIPCEIGSIN